MPQLKIWDGAEWQYISRSEKPDTSLLFVDQSGGTGDTYGVLSGTLNGSNTTFTVSKAFYLSGSLSVYLNGQLQTQGSVEDWQETTPASGTFDFTIAPESTDEIVVSYVYSQPATSSSSSSSFVYNEVPSGTVNSSNDTFTLANTPETNTLQLFRNGLLQKETEDYTLSTATITFVTPPTTGSILLASYQLVVNSVGNADTLDGLHASAFVPIASLPPTTTATNDFQVGGGAGAWIKNTLAETQTILSVVKASLVTAANDFLIASGSGVVVKKTLAETQTILSVVKASLVTAANDFLIASGSGVVVKKTLAETKTILGITTPLNSIMDAYPIYIKDWINIEGYTQSLAGTGSFSYGAMYGYPHTGATINSEVIMYSSSPFWLIPSSRFFTGFKTRLDPVTTVTNLTIWMGILTNPTAPTATEAHCAFKILNGAIYASSGNGTNGELTDTGLTIAQYQTRDYDIKHFGTYFEFYVDGVLKATHSIYYPNTYSTKATFYMTNTAAEIKAAYLFPYWIKHD